MAVKVKTKSAMKPQTHEAKGADFGKETAPLRERMARDLEKKSHGTPKKGK